MDLDKACHTLKIAPEATLEEIEAARRSRLSALHPDHHSSRHKAIFEELTRDIIEAADFMRRRREMFGAPEPPARPRGHRRAPVAFLPGGAFSRPMVLAAAGIALLTLIPVLAFVLVHFLAGRVSGDGAALPPREEQALRQAAGTEARLREERRYRLLLIAATAYEKDAAWPAAAACYREILALPGRAYDERALRGLEGLRAPGKTSDRRSADGADAVTDTAGHGK